MKNKFGKQERIVSQKLIDQLFGGSGSRSLSAFPLRVVYMKRDIPNAETPTQILVSVPKRHLHHAVDRNRVKRQIREAYRHQKHLLADKVDPNQMLVVAFVWLSDQLQPSAEVDSKVKNLLERIARKL